MRASCEYMSIGTQRLWDRFAIRFRCKNSRSVYYGDINQCMEISKKDLLEFCQEDADKYYQYLLSEVRSGNLHATTVKKKIKELHTFSKYITEQESSSAPSYFKDFFYIYAIQFFGDEELRNLPRLEDIDKLMDAAKSNIMHYAILSLAHRVGLKSTQICNQKISDIVSDPNGVYFILDKDKIRYIPDDVWAILQIYLETYRAGSDIEYLFYNKRGRKLNVQYISSMMKDLCKRAGTKPISYMDVRNTCGAVLFASGAQPDQVAHQMGIGMKHIRRYDNIIYRHNMQRETAKLVNLRVVPPK